MHTTHTIHLNKKKILVASDGIPSHLLKHTLIWNTCNIDKDLKIFLPDWPRSKILFGFFILTASTPLLFLFLFFQSFAFLFVATWTPMRSLALFVAILNRAAAQASLEFAGAGLWVAAR